MNRSIVAGAVVAIAILIVGYASTFFVHQSQNAVVVRFGRLIDTVINEPGLHWRVPFIDQVIFIDRRVINFSADSIELPTLDQKRIVLSAYVRYRITDPQVFYTVARTEQRAESLILQVLSEVLRDRFGSVPMQDILTEKRAALMTDVKSRLEPTGNTYGIQIVDVRFKRVDLPAANSEAVYNRMRTQRAQEAAGIRASGTREAREKRAEADKQRVVVLAEARKKSEIERGLGDAEATKIYNEAFGRDPEFFDFYRSLQAMRTGLGGDSTTFVGQPKGDFFRFFERGEGSLPSAPAAQ
ncbi:MAG: protease modulator HflC [Rhodospirillaceae bacterium]|jgi:membrane protease subunit HflC|nr:protease modulator HflC [Rhodospirillaceae bacterium]